MRTRRTRRKINNKTLQKRTERRKKNRGNGQRAIKCGHRPPPPTSLASDSDDELISSAGAAPHRKRLAPPSRYHHSPSSEPSVPPPSVCFALPVECGRSGPPDSAGIAVGIAGAASAFDLPGTALRLDSQFSRSGIVAWISRCFYVCLGFWVRLR